MANLVESIQSAIENFKSTMKALKVAAIGLLAGTAGYVGNEITTPDQPPVVAEEKVKPADGEIVKMKDIDAPSDDVQPIEEIGAKPLIVYNCYFGWDYVLEIPDEVVPLVISGPGKPSYEANVKVPGYSKNIPVQNTVFEVATRTGEPSEKEALKIISRRGEKLVPPRKDCVYAGLVRVEPVRVITRKVGR